MEIETFSFVIGHTWKGHPQSLISTYAYGNEVKHGTIKEADEFLAYVNRKSPGKDWAIYKLVKI